MGGRKFGFSNLVDVGCSPFLRALNEAKNINGSGCMDEVTVLAELHNKALAKALKKLERKLEGFKYSNFDLFAASKERIDNPSKYGTPIYYCFKYILIKPSPTKQFGNLLMARARFYFEVVFFIPS